MKSQRITRNINFDLLRILASFMIVILHVAASDFYSFPADSFEWFMMNLYNGSVRCAVPLFFMLSGAFLIRNEIDLKTLFKKNVLRIFAIYLLWSCLYAIDTINPGNLPEAGFMGFLNAVSASKYHLWFLPVMAGIYLLQPIFCAIARYEQGKLIPYLIMLFISIGVIKYTILCFPYLDTSIGVILDKVSIELCSYSGYFIIGHYLANVRQIKIKPYLAVMAYLLVALVATLIGQFYSISVDNPTTLLYGNFALPVFLESICLFIAFQNLNFKNVNVVFNKAVSKVSKLTLGIYLLHPFVMEHLNSIFGINVNIFNMVLSIPFLAIFIFLLCLVICWAISIIPFVRAII